ncbi:L-aminoadipate-semialdehyde dehydrogenase-phosphopantetheinyl transferase isoform X5 [Gadus morhua]|uniref:L-aminoadipate-semialdehyde dehydrogenase-phosphopantetheinyl transferase isoform X5 n=1 Tax=Gadus morhua TaxID=8049 RepID=UPI0011B44EB8|nr:L-aminoadipate-semialdehyde dehydrogenase-phosphopantetheinyl transferase isoform X5 [Gadus morhua]
MSDHNQNNNRDAYISYLAGRLLLRKFVCERIAVPWSEIQLARSPRGKPYLVLPEVGRLLLRKFVCERIAVPWSEIQLARSPRGKPYLVLPEATTTHTPPLSREAQRWSFNISHQGEYAVLAAEQGLQVGVDVMKTTMPGSSSVSQFFRIMTRQFTEYEWSVIQSSGSERQQLAAFYRHWLTRGGNPEALLHAQALKESFIKAIGTGLGFNLQRAEFHLSPQPVTEEQGQHRTMMHLDEEEEHSWRFEECLLDADHHVAVALGLHSPPPAGQPRCPSPPPPTAFTHLTFGDLIAQATPLSEEDPAYWDGFQSKGEAPQRQSSRAPSE